MSYYLEVLKKYASFRGRAQRKEYWYFVLFQLIIYFFFVIILSLSGNSRAIENVVLFLSVSYYILTFIPTLAVTVRRLHDAGSSGWAIFLQLVPAIGGIILLAILVSKSVEGENSYGPNPKGANNSFPSTVS